MAKIVGDNGIIRARIITPGHGSSGYYSAGLLEKAVPKFNGAKVYWDHPLASEEASRPERSLRDLAGKVMPGTARFETGKEGVGIYADVQVYKPFQEAVNELGPDIGLSIRGQARGKSGKVDGKEAMVIESIDSIQSVDFVTLPGRGGKVLQMFEAARGSNTTQQEVDMTEAEVQKLVESTVTKAVTEAVAAVTAPVQGLQQRALRGDAMVEANRILKTVSLGEISKQRIVEAALREIPQKDGELDGAKFSELVMAEAKREGAYVAQLTGAGRVVGMGEGIGLVPDKAERKRLKEAAKAERKAGKRELKEAARAWEEIGLDPKAAERAAEGRVA